MPQPPPSRRFTKWAVTAACAVIALAWAANLRWTGRIHTKNSCVEIREGCVWLLCDYPRPWRKCGWSFRTGSASIRERLGLRLPEASIQGTYLLAIVPLWMPFSLATVPTVALWYRDRRGTGSGHCRRCGYNLTGAEHEKCPECGAAKDTQAVAHVGNRDPK